MIRTLVGALLGVTVVLGARAARAEEQALVTDRPDVAESSETVGALRFQAETSALVETDRRRGWRRTALRTPLKLRFGLIDRLELHLESDGFARDWGRTSAGESASATGAADLELGGKVHLFDQRRALPSTGILLSVSLPVGSAAFSAGNTTLSPTLAAGWDLNQDWSVGANLGATLALTGRAAHPDTLRFAAALWRSWAPLSDRLSSFVEPSGEIALDGADPAVQLQAGCAFLFTPALQGDLALIFGLTPAAADFGTTVGFSFKL